jgi:hypothetical protein
MLLLSVFMLSFSSWAEDDTPACELLEVGKSKYVNLVRGTAPATVEHKYRLKRVGEKRFEVGFFINFSFDKSFSEKEIKQIAADMNQKIPKCLEMAKGKIRGPKDEEIDLAMYSPKSHSDLAIYIKIGSSRYSHSREWKKDFSCATMVHELLHYAGLVDEKPNPAYECRKKYEFNTIMSEPQAAWKQAVGYDLTNWIYSFFYKQLKDSTNLIEARHFNVIILPECVEKNKQYYRDSFDAYRTTEKGYRCL